MLKRTRYDIFFKSLFICSDDSIPGFTRRPSHGYQSHYDKAVSHLMDCIALAVALPEHRRIQCSEKWEVSEHRLREVLINKENADQRKGLIFDIDSIWIRLSLTVPLGKYHGTVTRGDRIWQELTYSFKDVLSSPQSETERYTSTFQ